MKPRSHLSEYQLDLLHVLIYLINVLAEDIHKAYVMSLFQGGLAGLLWQGVELRELSGCFLASVVWKASRWT